MADENVTTEPDDTEDPSTETPSGEAKEPSGFETADGKDLDKRYMLQSEFLENDVELNKVVDAVLINVGVLQQDPINGVSSPYTLPAEAFVKFRAYINVRSGAMRGSDISLTMYIDDEVVFTGSKHAERGGNTATLEKTITGFYKAGTIFKANFTHSGATTPTQTFSVTASPYSLYKIERNEEEVEDA